MPARGRGSLRQGALGLAGESSAQETRAKRALGIVGMLALAVVAISALGRIASDDALRAGPSMWAGQAQSYVGQVRRSVLEGEDLGCAIGDTGAFVLEKAEVPGWFADELHPLDAFEFVAATHDWTAVWLKSQHEPGDALRFLAEELAASGWSGYESGLENQVTFVKEDGLCQWAMMTCSQVGEETDVVVRLWRAS